MYLDFFSTNVQRTAVTTAANCCRNIPPDSFDTVKEIMPNLKTIISGTDQKVVEQGCLCLARIVDGFKHYPDRLEQLVSEDVLEAVLAILLPGSTSVAGSSTHTQLLRLLGLLVRNSAKIGAQLLRMNLIDTVYQILTGVSPPEDHDMESRKKTSIFVLQALIHRPHNQILETLGIICDLFPDPPTTNEQSTLSNPEDELAHITLDRSRPSREQRKDVLDKCHDDVIRFSKIIVPTLLDIYSSTIIFTIRHRVLNALVKIFIYLDRDSLRRILTEVQLASFLAGMLSQQDHPMLTLAALRLSELLARKLPDVYRMHFQREGIIAEVTKLASETASSTANGTIPASMEAQNLDTSEDDSEEDREESEDDMESPFAPQQTFVAGAPAPIEVIRKAAKTFLKYYHETGTSEDKAEETALRKLQSLGKRISSTTDDATRMKLFKDLARYFEGDLKSITTFELLESKVLNVLLDTLSNGEIPLNIQRDFLLAFAERRKGCIDCASPLEILVVKLQELLSRSERFEVISVSQGPYDDNRRNPASMLAKQIRLKVIAEDKSVVPKECQQFTVSIHAISQIHNLASFIRNKIVTYSFRPASAGNRDPADILRNLSEQRSELAALAQEMGIPFSANLARRAAALTSTSAPNTKTSSPAREGRRTKKRQSDASQATLDSALDTRTTASESELEENDENDEELVDEMEGMDEESESSVNVDVPTPTATPSNNRPATQAPSRAPPTAMSYAAALQQTPQDWHLEFDFGGHTIPLDSTVFEPLHRYSGLQTPANGYYHIFSGMHTMKYRKVPGPSPPNGSSSEDSELTFDSLNSGTEEPLSPGNTVAQPDDTSASTLKLLKLLRYLCIRWDEILGESDLTRLRKPDLVSQFVNTKLTAKLNRQLEEPLLIASNCLPTWAQDLARHYPFLFPFETRYLFVQSTSFGYSRCMNRWVPQRSGSRNDRRDLPLGRQQRSKLKLASRDNFLRLALTAMYKYAHKPPVLEMEYEDEVGTGLGPTLEFYANTSKEFAKRKLQMWRENDAMDSDEFMHVPSGLFPAPLPDGKSIEEEYALSFTQANYRRMEYLFTGLGKFVARSMLDSRIIDIHFNPLFFRLAENADDDYPNVHSLRLVDKRLSDSLRLLQHFVEAKQDIQSDISLCDHEKREKIQNIRIDDTSVDDLTLDFTLPGYGKIELKPGGKNLDVTIENVDEYIDLVVDFTIGRGIRRQIAAFKNGFSSVFPYDALCAFTADELVMVFGKSEEDWSYDMLLDCVKADHGFNIDSRSVRNLLEILSSLTLTERRTFLQFLTGSPKLPIGGFKQLLPPFTVVCKPNEPPLMADDYLPSVMTCANYLKLPDYTSKEVMRQKIFTAMTEGSQSFHLS
jgi:E3 ubiquitin-protein ligase TRIP12